MSRERQFSCAKSVAWTRLGLVELRGGGGVSLRPQSVKHKRAGAMNFRGMGCVGLLVLALGLAGCGGGDNDDGNSSTQAITNTAPTALTPANETTTTEVNTPKTINLLANNTTPNAGGVLALVGTPTVTNGVLTVSGSSVTVTPNNGFGGDMVVSYVVGDGKAANINETATITVLCSGGEILGGICFN